MASSSTATTFSASSYFATQAKPSSVLEDQIRVRDFVKKQRDAGRNVVLVTSGGTTVPLELNVVRFLDNFSAGTRGATSAEYFLDAGYAVIFMHRQFSLQPFSRHYSHSLNPFMDLLAVEEDGPGMAGAAPPAIVIVPEARTKLLSVLTAYRKAHVDGTLLTLNFVTVNDYLWLLKAVSEEMAVLKRRAMYYLAAAVSDFFLPTQKMSEHKIQSGKGTLNIEMDQVPKILKPMVDEWTPEGFVVSFKLETDSKILIPKARASLERYGHQVVIGNELNRRKFEVVFVSKAPSRSKSTITPTSTVESNSKGESPMVEEWLRLSQDEIEQGKEIESDIVERLVRLHATYIDAVKM